mmetsp:Transcript_92784/g.300092  ORF Transcript_92784/g.300092 Transcript_92784/m.300092 type:complete len:208 (+) Transcript_92784:937-1560(+)
MPTSPARTSTAPMASASRRRKTRSVYRFTISGWSSLSVLKTRLAKPTVSGSKPRLSSSELPAHPTTSSSSLHCAGLMAWASAGCDAWADSEGKPIDASHSATKLHGNFESMLVLVGTTSPILRRSTSEISSSASEVMPRLESRMANAMTHSMLGLGSGRGHLASRSQQSSSCFCRSSGAMMPILSAAKELDSMPNVTPSPWGTTPSP